MIAKGLGMWHLLETGWDENALKEAQNPHGIGVHQAKMSTMASCSTAGSLQGLLVPWGQRGNIIPIPHRITSASIRVMSQRLPVTLTLPFSARALAFSKAPGLNLPLGHGIFLLQ